MNASEIFREPGMYHARCHVYTLAYCYCLPVHNDVVYLGICRIDTVYSLLAHKRCGTILCEKGRPLIDKNIEENTEQWARHSNDQCVWYRNGKIFIKRRDGD